MGKGGFPRGGMGNMNNMIKQAQKMQQDLAKAQEEVEKVEMSATSGGGAVTAVANGQHRIVSLEIDPEAVDLESIDMLQDMVIAAVNGSLTKVDEYSEQKLGGITGGMNLPF